MPARYRSSAAATATVGCPFQQAGTHQEAGPVYENTLPFSEVPTPKGLPILGTAIELIRSGGAAKIHEYCHKRHQELGPIFREKMGALDVVVVSNEDYITRVYRSEGKNPMHLVPEPWLIYNEKKGIKRGLFFMDGEQWRSRRSVLNHLLIPKIAELHGHIFTSVVNDVVDRWEKIVEKTEDGVLPNLENELYNWSIETLGTMVFGRRLGCVMPAESESQLHEFVHQVQQIFKESATMAIIPPKLASTFRLPVWRRFESAADTALDMARGYVEQRIAEIDQERKTDKPIGGILRYLLDIPNIVQNEIVNIVADLILAAADTTSHATQWALYSLARNPECQEKILSEIARVVPDGREIDHDDIKNIPYLMKIVKETLRLYPIASFLTRVLPEKIVLGNYEIPAGKLFFMSQYTVGRDPERFDDPEKFDPDRWDNPKPNAHGCMPFGHGARGCIGRKVAELKMQLLLAKAVQRYHIEAVNEKEVGIALRMITTPDQPIKLRLTKRT
ncbi:cytochrome P450 315a1, mitochondrial [Trichonephila inaurata madagascariensis]|uniref:Cytochrome P450 315a1, mitochondrial n=1 Tax=Trichonephila inaurata madagascariensis TaxID=2747483 RepID=A0A8X6ITV1_9ARAC|nr:cytochrome P450 315a1, mitochondrial [Trichonephila inaurata madagascariensis]